MAGGREEYKAYVSIGNNELEKFAIVSQSDLLSEVAAKIKRANNISRADIMLQKDGIALDSAKTLKAQETTIPLLGNDGTYRFGGILVLEKTVTLTNVPEKIVAIESRMEALVLEVESQKRLVKSLMELVKSQDAEIRRRPKGWVKLLYPGNLVWIRQQNETLLSPDLLYSIHQHWVSALDASTKVYSVAVNGPKRDFVVECEVPDDGAGGGQKVTLEVWCIRVILPLHSSSSSDALSTFGQIREYDAIGGWKRIVSDGYLEKNVTETVTLLGDIELTPYETEYYLNPAVGTVIPSKANKHLLVQ